MMTLPSYVDTVVIGAGITGLVLATRLKAAGRAVVVLERDSQPGGLLGSIRVGQVTVDRYYHHFFAGDIRLKALLNDTGLSSRTSWHNASIALLDDTGFHRLTTPIEVFTYNGLSLADKARLALLMRAAAKARLNNSAMDDISAREWAEEVAGTRVWERFLYPLVSAKFGQACDEISAAWLAGRISCRSSRRWQGERLGYIHQGFFQLPFRLADGLGRNLFLDHAATGLITEHDEVKGIVIEGRTIRCANIVFTGGAKALKGLLGEHIAAILPSLHQIRFQGIVCGIFAVDRPPEGAYWTNVTAKDAPFNVAVQQNLLVEVDGSQNVIYVSKYLEPNHLPMSFSRTEDMLDEFQTGLAQFFEIAERDVKDRILVCTSDAGPVFSMGYRTRMEDLKPLLRGFHIGGMLLSYPDRSVEQSVVQAEILAERLLDSARK